MTVIITTDVDEKDEQAIESLAIDEVNSMLQVNLKEQAEQLGVYFGMSDFHPCCKE